jgi:hypothetical protein
VPSGATTGKVSVRVNGIVSNGGYGPTFTVGTPPNVSDKGQGIQWFSNFRQKIVNVSANQLDSQYLLSCSFRICFVFATICVAPWFFQSYSSPKTFRVHLNH